MEPAALDRATKKRMSEITTWVAYTRVTWGEAQNCVDKRLRPNSVKGALSLEDVVGLPIEDVMAEFARLRFMEARALIEARKACEAEVKMEIEALEPVPPPEATGSPATSEGYVDRSEGVPAKSVAV